MHTYRGYGLTIASEIPLLEMTPACGAPDVVVRLGPCGGWASGIKDKDYYISIEGSEARFWFKEAGTFVVRGGATVEVDPNEDAAQDALRLYIEGMMMAMVLHQRGFCVLHASVVNVDGSAIAFIGYVGAGKSSIAAALHARGHAVVADDNAAVLTGSSPVVFPAFPYLKLFSAIAEGLGYTADSLQPLPSPAGKVAGCVSRNFHTSGLPLKRIYVLSRGNARGIAPIPPSQAVLQLVLNSVPTRWGYPGAANDLQQCGSIAAHVPAFRVRSFDAIADLPALAEQIEMHCRDYQGRRGPAAISTGSNFATDDTYRISACAN